MLVGAHDGRIDHRFAEIGILGQCGEHRLPDASARPAGEAHVRAVPVAEFARQVAPRAAVAGNP
jgi:hypothetical protein